MVRARGAVRRHDSYTFSRNKEKTIVSKSVSYILKLPKCHFVDCFQLIDTRLDPTLTGKLEQDEAALVLWILTRVRPNFKVWDLRCSTYEEIFVCLQAAAQREKDNHPATYDNLIQSIQAFLADDEIAGILQCALELGFDHSWFAAGKNGTKKVKSCQRLQDLKEAMVKEGKQVHGAVEIARAGKQQKDATRRNGRANPSYCCT